MIRCSLFALDSSDRIGALGRFMSKQRLATQPPILAAKPGFCSSKPNVLVAICASFQGIY